VRNVGRLTLLAKSTKLKTDLTYFHKNSTSVQIFLKVPKIALADALTRGLIKRLVCEDESLEDKSQLNYDSISHSFGQRQKQTLKAELYKRNGGP
jgi:hypothetical protein